MKESLLWSMCGEWWWWCVYNIIWVAGLTLDKAALISATIAIKIHTFLKKQTQQQFLLKYTLYIERI